VFSYGTLCGEQNKAFYSAGIALGAALVVKRKEKLNEKVLTNSCVALYFLGVEQIQA
jgi:hypothetical protein